MVLLLTTCDKECQMQVPHGAEVNAYSNDYTDVLHQMPHGMDSQVLPRLQSGVKVNTHNML